MDNIASIAWPMVRLPEAIEVLARRAGLKPATNGTAVPLHLRKHSNQDEFEAWLDWLCARIGIEIEAVEANASDFSDMLRGAGPALLRHQYRGEPLILLLLKATARSVQLIGQDLKVKRYPLDVVQAAICAEREKPVRTAVEGLIQPVNISMNTRTDVIQFLVREQMADQRLGGCWILRMPPTTSIWRQLAVERLPHRILGMFAIYVALYISEIVGWMMIGQGALDGRLDYGWLVAWVLLLLMMVPLQFVGSWLQGMIAINFGTLLKQRLLSGALRMDIDKVRRKGVGELLGYVIESQALESLALNGGFSVVMAAIELSLAASVLAWGAGGLWHVMALLVWMAGTLSVSWFYYQRLRRWTWMRIALTHDLIEQMMGHRTRIAQELPDERHLREDQSLERFLHVSSDFDKAFVPLAWGAPRGWLIIGLLSLVPAFVWNKAEISGLAVSLGGVLLAYRAFGEVGTGLAALARALVAGEILAPLWKAAQQNDEAHRPSQVVQRGPKDSNGDAANSVVIQARDLIYRYGRQGEAVLKGCNLTIYHGDRLLLEGTSGSGKSTLAALLVGLRHPDSGLLMLNGLDQATLGQGWRRLSTAASQFHENHILTGTVAFNLLMGRRWPPTVEDMAEARQLCDELGLGDLLSRMPSGLMQIVGETGWQLSHGERSRLYLARALLQKAELVVLDESFAALDPETLTQCLRCALSRAPTLVVIAHP